MYDRILLQEVKEVYSDLWEDSRDRGLAAQLTIAYCLLKIDDKLKK